MSVASHREARPGTRSCRLDRRDLLRCGTAAALGATAAPLLGRTVRADAADLDVFTFSVYTAPELHDSYVEQYGGLPSFSMMSSLEEGFFKLTGGYRPQIAITGYEFVGRWRDAGILEPIDPARLSNWPDVIPKLMESGQLADGEQWAIPFTWGNSSVVYRTDLLPEYAEVADHTWQVLWDPAYEGRLAVRDSAEEAAMPAALIAGVADPFNMTDAEIAEVEAMLREQHKLLRFYWDDQSSLAQAIAAGEVVAAFATSDVWAQLHAEGVPVGYMSPREGFLTWIDLAVLIVDNTLPEEQRYAYLDALLAPESGAFIIESYAFGHANRRAFEQADQSMVQRLGWVDPDVVVDRGILLRPYDPTTQEKLNRIFADIKAGE